MLARRPGGEGGGKSRPGGGGKSAYNRRKRGSAMVVGFRRTCALREDRFRSDGTDPPLVLRRCVYFASPNETVENCWV